MKTSIYKALAGSLLLSLGLTACSEEKLSPRPQIDNVEKNAFDHWLYENYVGNYNIDFKYKMEDIERDHSKNLVPAKLEQSMKMAKIVRHAWLGAYDEVAGKTFMRRFSPRILSMIGSASWNEGTITLATAEAGLKVVLYRVNELDHSSADVLNRMFFQTMHHEFAHILHQNVSWPQEYNLISASDYVPSSWHNRNFEEAAKKGFITQYAGSQAREDIAEITSCYITHTQADWDKLWAAAGEEGRKKIEQKIKIVKEYMKSVWQIDMDQLKEVAYRRGAEVVQLNLIEESWKPLLANELRAITPYSPEYNEQRSTIVRALLQDPELLDTSKQSRGGGSRCQIITQYQQEICNH